ncbi:MAG: PAS domain-containing protein [Methanomicrobiales archaeon]
MISVLIIGDYKTLEKAKILFSGASGEIHFNVVPTLDDALPEVKLGSFDLLISEYSKEKDPKDYFTGDAAPIEMQQPFIVIAGKRNNIPAERETINKGISGERTRELFGKLGSRISGALEKSSVIERQKENQARLCSILASINTGVFIVDRSTRVILHANDYALRMMQKSLDQIIGHDYQTCITISDQSDTFLSLPDEGVLHSEGELVGRNGTIIPVILNVTPVQLQTSDNLLITFLDNSSRKMAEKALADSEAMFGKLVETSPDAILLTDLAGKILRANMNAQELFGFTREEDIKSSFLDDLYSTDDTCSTRNFFEKLIKNGWLREEIIAHSVDNHNLPIEISSSIICDSNGKPFSMIHVIRDLTYRRQAEETLKASEERYRNIVEDQNEFICRFMPDGTHFFVNGAYCRYFGKTREEIAGSRFRPVIHPDDRTALKKHFESLTPENPVGLIDHRIIMPDGEIRWQRWSDRAIFDDDGTPVEYQSVGRDITVRKEMEHALMASEERYRNVVEDQTEFICRFLPDGTHVFVNGAYCRYFGKTREEITGSRFTPIIYPEDRAALKKHFESLSQDNPVAFIEHRIVMPHGEIRWQRWSDRAIFVGNGSLVEYQSVGRDISYRKK